MNMGNWRSPAEIRKMITATPEASFKNDFYRLWLYEIKPSFKAEEDFLLKYPVKTRAAEEYAEYVFIEHGRLEEMFWKDGENNIYEFMRRLSALIRYKEDYFIQQVAAVLEKGFPEPAPINEDPLPDA